MIAYQTVFTFSFIDTFWDFFFFFFVVWIIELKYNVSFTCNLYVLKWDDEFCTFILLVSKKNLNHSIKSNILGVSNTVFAPINQVEWNLKSMIESPRCIKSRIEIGSNIHCSVLFIWFLIIRSAGRYFVLGNESILAITRNQVRRFDLLTSKKLCYI